MTNATPLKALSADSLWYYVYAMWNYNFVRQWIKVSIYFLSYCLS